MLHNVETLIEDLESSIPVAPNVVKMEAAEEFAKLAARPKWDAGEMFDIDEAMQTTVGEGEIPFSKLSRAPLMSQETSVDEVARVAADVLRRLNSGDDILKRDNDIEPPEENPEAEPVEPPNDKQLQQDMMHLRAAHARGEDVYEIKNALVDTDYPPAVRYGLAISALGSEIPA